MMFYEDAACISNIGKIRSTNDDNFYFFDQIREEFSDARETSVTLKKSMLKGDCIAVFDGMGGLANGFRASLLAAQELKRLIESSERNHADTMAWDYLIHQLNSRLVEDMRRFGGREMGTTIASMMFDDNRVNICNLGDSKIFCVRKGKMKQISRDHTDWEFLKRRGITNRRPSLLQYLGMPEEDSFQVSPYCTSEKIVRGDKYLICSDGLTDMLAMKEIERIISEYDSAKQCARILVDQAMKNGGKDNITVITNFIVQG